jgi:hypothetical protein
LPAAAQQPVPFRVAAARHRKSLQYTISPWVNSQRITIPLINVGYLAELQLYFALTQTIVTGTVTDAAQANSNYFPFVGLRSPQGEYIWTSNSRDFFDFQYRLERSVTPSTDPSYAAPNYGSSSAQAVTFRLRIPVSLNDGQNFDFGLIMRQISNNQFFLDVQFANGGSDLVGAGSAVISSITGSVVVEEIYYDAVQANSNVIPPNFNQYVRLRSITSPPLVNGQNDVRYDTGPIMVDALHRIINNGAADGTIANCQYIQFLANKGNEIDNRTGVRLAYDNTMHLGKALRAGVYHEDFMDDAGLVNQTKARDFINSNLAAQLDFLLQYGGSPSGNSVIQSFYREIVTLGA